MNLSEASIRILAEYLCVPDNSSEFTYVFLSLASKYITFEKGTGIQPSVVLK